MDSRDVSAEAMVSHGSDHTGDVVQRATVVMRGMAHRHRIRVLILLRSGELTFAAITDAVPAERTAIGHQLRYLLDAGLVRRRRHGRNVFYSLSGDAAKAPDVLVPRPSKYPEQFRRDAVELVCSSGRTLREVGRELGVNHETLRGWVNAAKRAGTDTAGGGARGGELSAVERDELRPDAVSHAATILKLRP
jgi:transposase